MFLNLKPLKGSILFTSIVRKHFDFCLILVLLILSGHEIFSQDKPIHPKWPADQPEKHQIKMYYNGIKIKSEVKIQYYLGTEEYRYFRRKRNSKKRFGEDFEIDKEDRFIVNIEFRPEKGKEKQPNLLLEIPSKSYIRATGCLRGPVDFEDDFKVYHGGNRMLEFKLVEGCEEPESTILVDFEFSKNGKELTEKSSGSKKYIKNTAVVIPIRVYSSTKKVKDFPEESDRLTATSATKNEYDDKQVTITSSIDTSIKSDQPLVDQIKAEIERIEESSSDLDHQIFQLQILHDETSDPTRKASIEKKIREKVATFCEDNILKAAPCDQIVQEFGGIEGYEIYLSAENLKRYQKYKESCEQQRTAKADDKAFANAENRNTITAYKLYKSKFPKGMHVRTANYRIASIIKGLDKGYWEAAVKEAAQTDDPCEKLRAYEDYLTKLSSGRNKAAEADRLKAEASDSCITFRLESRNMDKEAGFYEFEIKNGMPPFIYSIDGGEEQVVDGRSIPLDIVKGGTYEFAVRAEDGEEFFHTFKAINPEFALIIRNGEILIKGGESPFSFSLKENQAIIHDLEVGQRSLKISDLTAGLGQKVSYAFILIDNNGKELGPERIRLGKDSPLSRVITLLLVVLLVVITYLTRNRIKPYVFKVLPFLDEEGKQWQRAMKAKTVGTFEAYEKKYPEGKYSDMVHLIKGEIQIVEQSLASGDFAEYLKIYGDKALFKKEIEIWKKYHDSGTFENCSEEFPVGIFREAAEKNRAEPEQSEAPRTDGLKPAAIDFLVEDTLGDKRTEDIVLPLSLPPHEYFQFDLNRHWPDSSVQKIWMSKEACLEAYFLIEDAIKNAFQQKETIPEVGGFLVGVPYQVNDKVYEVKIEKFVSVTPENNGEYEVTFGNKAFMELDDVLQENKDKGLTTVGWMHTHPGHGLFLSGKDVEVVDSFFKEPFHVSMEVETKTRDLDTAFFTRRKDLKLNTNKTRENTEEWFHWEDVKFWLKTNTESY